MSKVISHHQHKKKGRLAKLNRLKKVNKDKANLDARIAEEQVKVRNRLKPKILNYCMSEAYILMAQKQTTGNNED